MRTTFKIIGFIFHLAALLILLGVVIFTLMSCSKQTDYSYLNTDRRTGFYQMKIDHLSLDTSKIYGRYSQDLGYLVPSEAAKIDTAKDMWYINCATLDTLEHLYYLRDNKKIQP